MTALLRTWFKACPNLFKIAAAGLRQINRPWQRGMALVMAGVFAIALSSCDPSQFQRADAASVPRLVLSSLGDPKTFNPVLNDEANHVFGYTFEGLTTGDGITG
ncbi:MAG: hypothetical protein ICV62_19315, partial [Cyanobacteria bacterium Co-bin13]|nr:hypothetical protein [Cyanobacteria bacterium Co-bin13]